MVVGEVFEVEDYFLDYSSDEEMSDVQEDCGFFISSEDTDESLEKYEEDSDCDFAEMDEGQFFEDEQRIQEVAERLPGGVVSENTLEMLYHSILLGQTSCLTNVNTEELLMVLCEKVEKQHVPGTLEILMRRFAKLSEFHRKIILSIIAQDINSIKSSLAIIKRFLTCLIMSLLEQESFEVGYETIPLIHKIFCDLKNDPESIQNITTPKLVDGLLTLIGNSAVDVRDKQSIIQILAIMASNSEVISHALMRKSAVQKLARYNDNCCAGPETSRLDIATLIWAILPQSKEQEFFDEYEVISETIPSPIWRKEIRKDYWEPFSSSINFLIEQNYGKMMECSFIESGTIYTVNYEKMQVINEATSEQTAILRENSEHYKVLNLKKRKQESGNSKAVVSTCFVSFSFLFFCSRMNYVYPNSPEEYRCWQGLFTLFESITHHQHEELLEQELHYLVGNPLVARLKNLLTGENCDLKILAVRLAKQLITLSWSYFSEINELNYMVADIKAIAKKKQVMNDSAQAGVQNILDSKMKENFLKYLAKDFIKMPIVREVMKNKLKVNHPLGIMLEILMNTPTDITQRNCWRSLTLNKFLEFLTKEDGPKDRTSKLKEFLYVFANIPVHSQFNYFEISNKLFLVLLKKLKSIVWDSVGIYPIEWNENKEKQLLKAGSKTIGAISEKCINICLYTDNTPWSRKGCKLLVRPFTTIQFLELLVLRKTLPHKRERNIVFDDKSKIELSINGHRIPSEITIYEAILRFGNISGDKLFDEDHMMKFEKKSRSEDAENRFNPFEHPLDRHLRERIHSKDVPQDFQNAIQLIDILYGLNEYWTSIHPSQEHQYIVDPQEFETNLLSNMADISFNDPFSILVGKSPAWINCLLENCPFMFNPGTRKMAFRVLRLDRRRSFQAVMRQFHSFENQIFQNKITIRRIFLLNDVDMALRISPSYSSWSVAFENEVGTGVGLKRELFTLASRNLQKAELEMWPASDITDTGYIRVEAGLYPSISMQVDPTRSDDFTKTSLEEKFETLGLLIGKAIIEEQILDLPLALPVFKWILKRENEMTIDDLKYINRAVHKVLKDIQKIVEESEERTFRQSESPPKSKKMRTSLVDTNEQTIASYGLSFVVPGYDDIELIPDGANIDVTLENARIYLSTLQQFFFNFGVQKQMNALRNGLNSIINLDHLQIFHPEELQMMICGEESDDYWSVDSLYEHIVLEGFDLYKTAVIDNLFDILSSLSTQKRRLFLEFVTGCANLPVGGFKSLSPPLQIKPSEGSYPHAQTCFNTLYLPVNMSSSQLRQFIELAITEGLGYFGLA